MRFRTRAIHVGNERDPQTGAVIPPVHLATTFVQRRAGESQEYDYSRSGNPTRRNLERTLASLESGHAALAFSTGMAATHCVTMLLHAGEHIVAGADLYGGSYRLFHQICDRAGIGVTLVDTTDQRAIGAAINARTRLLWLESPGNPLMSITDLAACAALGKQQGIWVAVDNTFATPVLTRPIELGADIVMHSATKYLGGHSDVLGGVLVVQDEELYRELYFIQNATGAVLDPIGAFLVARGLKTLELRVLEQCRTAQALAEFLAADSRVRRVNYPGLPGHPHHNVARCQMHNGFGGMLSFEVEGDYQKAQRVVQATKLFQLAVSLGAVESLIEQPASMSHASYHPADRLAHGITDELIRISVGLEDVDDLRDDLDRALEA